MDNHSQLEVFKKTTPLFICGHYRSGTSMINHLFDGHPQVIANGYETKFFTHFLEQLRRGNDTKEALENSLLRVWTDKNEYRQKYFSKISANSFRSLYFDSLDQFEDKEAKYLEANTYAYGILTNQIKSSSKYWIEKTPHNEFYFEEIIRMWPNAVFLHVYRDPRDLHATLRKRAAMNFSVRTTIHNWRRSIKQMNKNRDILGSDKYLTLKYEDFVKDPVKCYQPLLEKLGIEFNDSLLSPTMAGGSVDWKGNAVVNQYNGVSNKSVGQWLKMKKQSEFRVIEIMLRKDLKSLNYEIGTSPTLRDKSEAFYHELAILYKELRYILSGRTDGAI